MLLPARRYRSPGHRDITLLPWIMMNELLQEQWKTIGEIRVPSVLRSWRTLLILLSNNTKGLDSDRGRSRSSRPLCTKCLRVMVPSPNGNGVKGLAFSRTIVDIGGEGGVLYCLVYRQLDHKKPKCTVRDACGVCNLL